MRLTTAYRWLSTREPRILLVCLLIVFTLWAVIALTSEVFEGDTEAFDTWAVTSLRVPESPAVPIGPPWLIEAGRDATALGGYTVLILMIGIVAGYLWLLSEYGLMFFVLASTSGGVLLCSGLKLVFQRARPSLVPHLADVFTSSFPSGHSMNAAVVYLTLSLLLAIVLKRTVVRLYILGVALVLTLLVGVSRVYLGVHYPTDVLVGWMIGLVWSLSCWLVFRLLTHRPPEGA
jgi:undecaprenyl-diphosphatase